MNVTKEEKIEVVKKITEMCSRLDVAELILQEDIQEIYTTHLDFVWDKVKDDEMLISILGPNKMKKHVSNVSLLITETVSTNLMLAFGDVITEKLNYKFDRELGRFVKKFASDEEYYFYLIKLAVFNAIDYQIHKKTGKEYNTIVMQMDFLSMKNHLGGYILTPFITVLYTLPNQNVIYISDDDVEKEIIEIHCGTDLEGYHLLDLKKDGVFANDKCEVMSDYVIQLLYKKGILVY